MAAIATIRHAISSGEGSEIVAAAASATRIEAAAEVSLATISAEIVQLTTPGALPVVVSAAELAAPVVESATALSSPLEVIAFSSSPSNLASVTVSASVAQVDGLDVLAGSSGTGLASSGGGDVSTVVSTFAVDMGHWQAAHGGDLADVADLMAISVAPVVIVDFTQGGNQLSPYGMSAPMFVAIGIPRYDLTEPAIASWCAGVTCAPT